MVRLRFTATAWLGWTVVIACSTFSAAARAVDEPVDDSRPQSLYLHTEFLPYTTTVDKGTTHRLGREIVRQAVLLAARDEMGLATYDETLKETLPANTQVVHLMLLERADLHGKWLLRLTPFGNKGKPWEKTYDYRANGTTMYAEMIPKLEADTRGVFLDALKGVGLKGEKSPADDPKAPGEEIETLLRQVDFVAQYNAVRTAHHEIAAHGETPQWLGVLVRGYANLAVLTRHQWNSATEVFTARSWLYAQRMMVSCPESKLARWHRAYAWALGGTLHHALTDLEQLEPSGEKDGQSGNTDNAPETAPPWTKLIKPYCMCDRAATKQVGEQDASLKPWATRLWYQLTSEYRRFRWTHDAGEETVKAAPTAYGVYAAQTYFGSRLGVKRYLAALAPSIFAQHVPQSLGRIPGLPEPVQQVVVDSTLNEVSQDGVANDTDSPAQFSGLPMAVARQLRQASQQESESGLSWSVLAYLLEEEQFVQIANFLDRRVSVTESPPTDQVDVLLPLVKEHRYAAYIDSFRYNPLCDEEALQQVLEAIRYEDPRRDMYSMFHRMWEIRDVERKSIGGKGYQDLRRNFTMPGLLEYIFFNGFIPTHNNPDFRNTLTNEVRTIAPHSEIGLHLAIRNVDKPTLDDLREWENQITEDPNAFSVLASRYDALGDSKSAIRCYEKSLQLVASAPTVVALAKLYQGQGNYEEFEQTLLEFLQTNDLVWERTSVHYEMAKHFIARGKWQKAKPHAQALGRSLTTWGLSTASLVSEALAEWEESERLIRTLSQNHPIAYGEAWYFWCRRTGRGDVESAMKLADACVAVELSRPKLTNFVTRGAYHVLRGDTRRGLAVYRRGLSFGQRFACSLMVAQLSRERGFERLFKRELAAMEKFTVEHRMSAAPDDVKFLLAGLAVIRLMKTGDASDERLAKIDDRLREVGLDSRAELAYSVGKSLETLGKSAQAEKYWRRCVRLPARSWVYTTLAGMELAKRHGTSRPDNDVLAEDDLWPPLPTDPKDGAKEEEIGDDAETE